MPTLAFPLNKCGERMGQREGGRGERVRERDIDRQISGISCYKDTNPTESRPHPYDLI